MACNNGNGNRAYQKSCVRYFNNAPQLLAADSENVLTLAGAKVVNSGSSTQLPAPARSSMVLSSVPSRSKITVKIGLYHLAADAVIAATAAGVLTLQWYMDGVALPCTLKRVTLPASGNAEIHTETDLELSGCCCCVNHTFTLVATTDSTAAGSVIELCTGLLKLA